MTGWMLGLIIAATGMSIGVLIGAKLWRPKRPKPAKPPKPQPEPEGVTGDIGAVGSTPPPELAPDRFDHTARIEIDETVVLQPTRTIAIGGTLDHLALEAATETAEPLQLPAPPPSSLAAWRPPDPRVILTVAWKRPDAQPVFGRYDVSDTMPDDVAPLYKAMRHQQQYDGGDITVAVKLDGHGRTDWEWKANDEWPRQSIDAIRQARDQLQHVHA